MADHDITLGETYRMAAKALKELGELPEKFVLRREYDINQQNTAQRFLGLASEQGKTQTELEQVQKEQAAAEKERQNAASSRRWQLFMLFASPIAAALVTILIFQGQAS